jgi:cellulose synthase/poly-beta-1,6-N-acetylglucosamine synthase-like glycosyltransferase
MKKPTVSIIIAARNSQRTIEQTLQSLAELDYPLDKLEIIFVNNNSSDSTEDILKKWSQSHENIKYYNASEYASPGYARNYGYGKSTGEIILFTDSDCVIERNWVNNITIPLLGDNNIHIVGGDIRSHVIDRNNDVEIFCKEVNFLSVGNRCNTSRGVFPNPIRYSPHEVNGSQQCAFFATANMAIRRDTFSTLGGFIHDNTGEDVDFCIRATKNGYSLFYEPEAKVYHIHRNTEGHFYDQVFNYGYNHSQIIKKYSSNMFEFHFNKRFICIPSFIKGIIYINNFLLAHIFVLVNIALFLFLMNKINSIPFTISILINILFFIRFFLEIRHIRPKNKFLKWMKIHYLSHLYCFMGSLKGSIKYKAISL